MNILSGEKLTPQEWCEITGIEIMDPDGWDRRVFEVDWLIPLTRDEFLGKAFLSTCRKWPHPLLDEEIVSLEHPIKLLKTEPADVADNVVPLDPSRNLLTAIDGLLATPEIAGLLDAAKAMFSIYKALVEAGFTEAQALTLTSQMTVGRTQ